MPRFIVKLQHPDGGLAYWAKQGHGYVREVERAYRFTAKQLAEHPAAQALKDRAAKAVLVPVSGD